MNETEALLQQMSQGNETEALLKQMPQETASEPSLVETLQSVPKSEYGFPLPAEYTDASGKDAPGFMKKAEIIGTGAAKGLFTFGANLAKIALGSGYKKEIPELKTKEDIAANISRLKYNLPTGDGPSEAIDKAYQKVSAHDKYLDEKYQGAGLLSGLGQFGTEMVATAPFGPAFVAASKAGKVTSAIGNAFRSKPAKLIDGSFPSLATKTVPQLVVGKVNKYGSAAAATLPVSAAMMGTMYDPEKPDQLWNSEAATDMLSNPLAAGLGALTAKFAPYMDDVQKLAKAKENFSKVSARHIEDQSVLTKQKERIFGFIPNLTDLGKPARLIDEVEDSLYQAISYMAGTSAKIPWHKLQKKAAITLHNTMKSLSRGEDRLWRAVPQQTAIKKVPEVQQEIKDLSAYIRERSKQLPRGSGIIVESIEELTKKGKLTVGEVKEAQTQVGNLIHTLTQKDPGMYSTAIDVLENTKQNLLGHIQQSLPESAQRAYGAASQFSAMQFKAKKELPQLIDAYKDVHAAKQIIGQLMTGSADEKFLNMLQGDGQKQVQAAILV